MKHHLPHVIIPFVFIAVFVAIACSPVDVLGCRTRGLLALSVALLSGLAGITTGLIGLTKRLRQEPGSGWWMISTCLLTIPVAALVLLA